jgi:hypothetical protein
VFEVAPGIFLGTECDVVDHHEVKEGVNELRSVGAIFVNDLLNVSEEG